MDRTHAFGYDSSVPTVLRRNGFDFRIYNNDHEPMHTHVGKAGKEIVINLGSVDTKPYVWENRGMRKAMSAGL